MQTKVEISTSFCIVITEFRPDQKMMSSVYTAGGMGPQLKSNYIITGYILFDYQLSIMSERISLHIGTNMLEKCDTRV